MDDKKVIKQILNGDSNAFSYIMEKYHNELFSYIYKMVLSYETTEDLLQDFFLDLYKKCNLYDETKASFRTWMYRLVSNFMISYLRKKKLIYFNVESETDFDFLHNDEDTEQELIKEEQMKSIVYAMQKVLKKKQLHIMSLHFFSGLSVKEIGETLDIPIKTIYKSIKTSIEKIRKEVELNE